MKIDYLQINSRFKNLDQVKINFDENELMSVVVGWNGAGKSNVLEALVSIFRNLDLGESPKFAYDRKNGLKLLPTHSKGTPLRSNIKLKSVKRAKQICSAKKTGSPSH